MHIFIWFTPALTPTWHSLSRLGSKPMFRAVDGITWNTPTALPWRVLGPMASHLMPLSFLAMYNATSTHFSPIVLLTSVRIIDSTEANDGVATNAATTPMIDRSQITYPIPWPTRERNLPCRPSGPGS